MRTFLSDLTYATITGKIQDQCAVSSRLSLTLLPCSSLSLQSRPSFSKWVLKMKSRFSQCFLPANVQKKTSLFFSSRNSGNTYTPLSIIFSIFSQQFLFPFFLNIASDIWLYWLLLPMSIRNAKWSLPKWNFQWMEREKEKRMKSYFPCWWCLYCCKSQTTVFFPSYLLLPLLCALFL